jgi:hypothetical protein
MSKKIIALFVVLAISVIVFQSVFVIMRTAVTDTHANWRVAVRVWHGLMSTSIARGDESAQGSDAREPGAPAVVGVARVSGETVSPAPSIVDYLVSVHSDASFAYRAQLAAEFGISGYVGSREQNVRLLELLRSEPVSGGETDTAVKERPGS